MAINGVIDSYIAKHFQKAIDDFWELLAYIDNCYLFYLPNYYL